MRARDLETDTAYATCNGVYVKVVDKRPNWALRPVNGKEKPVLVEDPKPTDPWGGCHTQRRAHYAQPKEYVGVRCLTYSVDRDGKPIGDGRDCVIAPRDISGTWLHYMSLYAETVRKRADDATNEALRKQVARNLETAFREAGFPALHVYTHLYSSKAPAYSFSSSDINEEDTLKLITRLKRMKVRK